MSNDASPRRDRAKTYHDCVQELRILVEFAEEYCGLGHAQLFVWEMEGAPVFILVPDDPEAGRDASTRLEEILGDEGEFDGMRPKGEDA
jgi:hypothetical protein